MESDESVEERWKELMKLKIKLGSLMRDERLNRKLSMRQVADMAEVAADTVSRVERGVGNHWSTFKVQRALDVDSTALWKEYELTEEYENNRKQSNSRR